MPSTDAFDCQDETYRRAVLPASVSRRLAVEAGVTGYWYKYVGLEGSVIGIDSFGASGPYLDVYEHFGITVEKVTERLGEMLDS